MNPEQWVIFFNFKIGCEVFLPGLTISPNFEELLFTGYFLFGESRCQQDVSQPSLVKSLYSCLSWSLPGKLHFLRLQSYLEIFQVFSDGSIKTIKIQYLARFTEYSFAIKNSIAPNILQNNWPIQFISSNQIPPSTQFVNQFSLLNFAAEQSRAEQQAQQLFKTQGSQQT